MEKPKLDWEAWFTVWVVVALFVVCIGAVVITGLWAIWPELRADVVAHPTDAIRNMALTFSAPVALIALYLAWRRTKDATRQVETQIRQADSAEIGQYHDRFQSALKMLENEQEKIQIAGVALLDRIWAERPDEFDDSVAELFKDLVSDQLKMPAQIVTRDLWALPKNPHFTSVVNSRMVRCLISDRLNASPEKVKEIIISRTRISIIETPNEVYYDAEFPFSVIFHHCHIEKLVIRTSQIRRFSFQNCQIDNLTFEYYGEPNKKTQFVYCVIGKLVIDGRGAYRITASEVAAAAVFRLCHYDDNVPLDAEPLFDEVATDRRYARRNGLRERRDLD